MSTNFQFDLGANVSDKAGGSGGMVTGRASFLFAPGNYYQVSGLGNGWTPEDHLQLTGKPPLIRLEAQEPPHAER